MSADTLITVLIAGALGIIIGLLLCAWSAADKIDDTHHYGD